ncbi:MAG: maltose alpha-D-glucosyltransferase [Thermovirgaceae bacterium]
MMNENNQWYKDAVIYQVHVKAFFDSNNDGIGDFEGLIRKLDYLKDLGVNTLWLLPFYPSPLRDDGYDIADYKNIHPDYGSLREFRRFLRKAHAMGFRVVTELVINHTSDQHPWFQRARKAKPGSVWRDFYVWSDDPNRFSDARIIFQDFETSNWTYDPVAGAYYWHRFYSHQPDLNFDNPRVRRAVLKILDHWMDMGVDGFRLDAVPYLFEREGTNCENLPETHQFLKELRSHVDEKYGDRMLLAEANQWPEDAVSYFGYGDECHMAFHFPIMPRIFMSLWMEDRFPIMDIMEQTPPIPDLCQWVMFLRNHDELTLEMVTDEERDYMYRVYARDPRARINLGIRRRLFPLVQQNRRRAELLKFILFSLPGAPCLYYGDEIGMGDNYFLGDRNGVRTPMQWSPDRNAGFSKVNPQKLYLPVIMDPEYHYEAVNVENQEKNPSSFLWWMRRVISMRKQLKALSRGDMEIINCSNPRILAFIRNYDDEPVLVVANLSRFSQAAELDLSEYEGYFPEEVFSGNAFPKIGAKPYTLTMGFHDYFWFKLRKSREKAFIKEEGMEIPHLEIPRWQDFQSPAVIQRLEKQVLPSYLSRSRWFGGKAKTIRGVSIEECIPVPKTASRVYFMILRVIYTEGAPEMYTAPVSFATGEDEAELRKNYPETLIAEATAEETEGVLYDGIHDPVFQSALLDLLMKRKRIRNHKGALCGIQGKEAKKLKLPDRLSSRILRAEQSNSSVLYDEWLFLKMLRKVEEGINPDREISRFLTEETRFLHTPGYVGALEYNAPSLEKPIVLGVFQEYVPNQGSAWSFTRSSLDHFFDAVLSQTSSAPERRGIFPSGMEEIPVPQELVETAGDFFFEMIDLLGQRTAELHLSLASDTENADFKPEPFSRLYQRSIYQSMRSLVSSALKTLRRRQKALPEGVAEKAKLLLQFEKTVQTLMEKITKEKIRTQKIRIHGDYHLGQVLFTGKDFQIIDFEGEPMRPLSERRLKRSPFRDLAGMLRSFDYAVASAMKERLAVRPQDESRLLPWRKVWVTEVSRTFLDGYKKTAGPASFIPDSDSAALVLLHAFLLEKAFYEVNYELHNRPGWLDIPITGILEMIQDATKNGTPPGGGQ